MVGVEREPTKSAGMGDMRASPYRRKLIVGLATAAILVTGGLGVVVVHPWYQPRTCAAVQSHPEWSVARRWDEALLDAIRRALPNPPLHARNLFHVSVAMWDAWAAYDPTASGYLVKEKDDASDVSAARDEAISYAAYRVLTARYIKSVGAEQSLSEFDDVMDSMCYSLDVTTTTGNSRPLSGTELPRPSSPTD